MSLKEKSKSIITAIRADEMVQMIDMSKEFGYKISAFHHTIEGL